MVHTAHLLVPYPVRLDWTACNFGGERTWFLCPTMGCGRRVAILYGGEIFACRHCYQLTYPANEKPTTTEQQGILNPKGWQKPKGMH